MEYLQLKGVRDGIRIVVQPSAKVSNIIFELKEKLEKSKEIFKAKEDLTIYVEGESLSHSDKRKIQSTIFELLGNDLLVLFENKKPLISPMSVFHSGTLRSGQNLQSEGHLVVLGDVNPGAELVAVGNIVVLGSLRGIVHAGASGDRNACVCALSMNPTQIRIADIITRSPDGSEEGRQPEMAYIKDDRIYIDSIEK